MVIVGHETEIQHQDQMSDDGDGDCWDDAGYA